MNIYTAADKDVDKLEHTNIASESWYANKKYYDFDKNEVTKNE